MVLAGFCLAFWVISPFPVAKAQTLVPTSTANHVLVPGVSVDNKAATGDATTQDGERSQYGNYARAVVRAIKNVTSNQNNGSAQRIRYGLEMLSGEHTGKTFETTYEVSRMPMDPEVGDTVIVYYQNQAGQDPIIFFESFDRQMSLRWILTFVLLAFLALAGLRGLKNFLGLLIMAVAGQFILVPLYLRGWTPVVCFLLAVGFSALFYSLILYGLSKRSVYIAFSGLLGSTLAYVAVDALCLWTKIAPGLDSSSRSLFGDNTSLDPLATISLGAGWLVSVLVLDLMRHSFDNVTAFKQLNPNWNYKEAFTAGINMGLDRLSSSATTVLAAGMGFGFLAMVATSQSAGPWIQKINADTLLVYLVPVLASVLGLALAFPVVVAMASASWNYVTKNLDPLRRAQSWRADESHAYPEDKTSENQLA